MGAWARSVGEGPGVFLEDPVEGGRDGQDGDRGVLKVYYGKFNLRNGA